MCRHHLGVCAEPCRRFSDPRGSKELFRVDGRGIEYDQYVARQRIRLGTSYPRKAPEAGFDRRRCPAAQWREVKPEPSIQGMDQAWCRGRSAHTAVLTKSVPVDVRSGASPASS